MPRPFFEILKDLRSGRTLEDCAAEMEALVLAVRETRKSGSLTITLKVKPPKAGNASYLMIEDSISTKVPKLDHSDTVFFSTKDGGLSRQDPSQQELFRPALERIDTGTGEITKIVNPGA